MRLLVIGVESLVLTFGLYTVAGRDHTEDKTHFDLVCHGSGQDIFERPQSSMRLSLDLDNGRFCIDTFCDGLTQMADDKLDYHCHGRDKFCEPVMSTGGPFVSDEDFVFDRAFGRFSRMSSGSVGDLHSRPFSASFSGNCHRAPFTGTQTNAR
jgi:hypothetical protein